MKLPVIMLANYDKPHRCPGWSRESVYRCDGGSFAPAANISDYGLDPRRLPLKCPTCGTWRLPTFGIRLTAYRARRCLQGLPQQVREYREDRRY